MCITIRMGDLHLQVEDIGKNTYCISENIQYSLYKYFKKKKR